MIALYLLYGVASLLPWHAYLKAIPRFQQMASPLSWSDSVPSLILTAFTGANLLTSLLAAVLLSCNAKMPKVPMPSVRTTVHGGLVVHALLLLGTIICCAVAPSMLLLLPLIFVAGVTSAVHQRALYTLLAPTPTAAPWFQGGQAAAGLASSMSATVLGYAEMAQRATTTGSGFATSLFFGGSIAVLLVALLASLVYGGRIQWPASEGGSEQKGVQSMRHMWPLVAGLWGCLSFTIFALRLLLLARSASGIRLFTQWVFVVYDVGDLLGKLAPAIQTLRLTSSAPIIALPFVRILLLLPPLLLTNTGGGLSPVQSDAIFYTLVLLFAVSNGYACTTLVMHALDYHRKNCKPGVAVEQSDGRVGTVVLLAINAGLATGSATSVFVPLMVRAVYNDD